VFEIEILNYLNCICALIIAVCTIITTFLRKESERYREERVSISIQVVGLCT